MTDLNATGKLRELIESVLAKKINVEKFCEDFERVYNFKLKVAGLSVKEKRVFEALFEKVVYFSPFPEERQKIPNYLDEQDILDGAREAWDELNQE